MCAPYVLMRFCHLLNSSFVCKTKEGRHIIIWSKTIGPFYFEKQTELLLYMNLLIYKLYFGQLAYTSIKQQLNVFMLNIKVLIKIIFRIPIEKGYHSSAKKITWIITFQI